PAAPRRRKLRRRLLVVTPWWPATPTDPFGSFVRDQAKALAAAGADVRVAALRTVKPDGSCCGAAPHVDLDGTEHPVTLVRAPWLPYRTGYDVLLRLWAASIRRAVHRQGTWARGAVVIVHTQDLAVPAHRALSPLGLPWAVVAHGLEPDSPRYERRDRMRAYR